MSLEELILFRYRLDSISFAPKHGNQRCRAHQVAAADGYHAGPLGDVLLDDGNPCCISVVEHFFFMRVALASKKITKLFCGKAEDAQKEGAAVLEPTTDTVTYKDGTSDEVYGFDVPVPALGEEFDCALMGTKGTWYDHLVSVSDPQPAE